MTGRCSARRALLGSALALVVASGCGGGSGGGAVADPGPAGWVAVELGEVPEGLEAAITTESSTTGRRVGYGDVEDIQIAVTARVPMGPTADDLLRAAGPPPEAGSDGGEGVVGGHRASVRPVGSGGWEVVWQPAPGLEVRVVDARTVAGGGLEASEASVLALAEGVRGLDAEGWTELHAAHAGAGSDAQPPPAAVGREVADGVLDGRQWTLTVLGPVDADRGLGSCFRLGYAGEDTGDGCAVERVVLGGKGFVLGWVGGVEDPGELVAGPGSSFDPIVPAVHSYGPDDEQHVSFAVLPDGACGVVRIPRAGQYPRSLDLLPGDPGAVECSTG